MKGKEKDGHHGHDGKHHSHMQHRAEGGRFARGGMIGGIPETGGTKTHITQKESQSGHKKGGKVHGHHARHRLDKKARGGRMTPSSPLSGADGPNLGYAKQHASTPSGGKGGERD